MTPCPGNCNSWWRALTHEQQAASETRPRPGDPNWCPACKAAIRRKLTDLDYQAAWLAFRADGHARRPDDPAHGANIPSPSAAADILEQLTGELWDWEDGARKLLGLPASFHTGYLPEIRSKVIAWLAERLDGILECDYRFAESFGVEISDRHWQLLGLNDARPPRLGQVPCPQCSLRLLAWVDDRGLACGNCPRHVSAEEYRELMHAAHPELERAG